MYDGTPCIVTAGCTDRAGYRQCNLKRFGVRVKRRHRLAWIDHHGMLPPPETPWILHHCDNPPCENALHLYAGTHADNTRDMWTRDRARPVIPRVHGERHWKARLTEAIVRDIRARAGNGERCSSIAVALGFNEHTVRDVILAKTWRHVV